MSKIYLVSPPEIELRKFQKSLESILKTGLISAFQLRLKDVAVAELEYIAKEINKICHNYNCLFILNDHLDMALNNNFGGAHIGQQDLLQNNICKKLIRNSAQEFIVGISCYDSLSYAFNAEEMGADYVSFGAFFPTKTKKSLSVPRPDIIKNFSVKSSLPIVAIGGINNENCHDLVKNGADFLAVISYIWQSCDPVKAIKKLSEEIKITINER